jgi:ABC-type Fe3+-hydroxamate transport system substrate-binding protein
MKKLILIAAIATLSACSKPTEDTPAPAETNASEAAPTMTAADIAGTYDAKYPDGTTHVVEITPDGAYTDTDANGLATKGMWSWKDGGSCFDPDGDAAAVCWTDSKPDANGVFTATAPDGTVVTVTPRAKSAAAAEPAPSAS